MASKTANMNELYPWLYSHFRHLIVDYQTRCNHHALLIYAIPGVGINMLIYTISCFLMCQQPKGYKVCNKCQGCNLMAAQTHPDYYILPFGETEATVGIDTIREINRKIYECSRLSGIKIVWLQNITQFTKAAINALLKTLEEPPEKTWFFISCYELSNLPMTLRSRCRLYHLCTPDESLAINWISRKVTMPLEMQLSALRLCGGAPIRALSHLHPNIWFQREQLCNMLLNVLKSNDWLFLLEILNQKQAVQKLFWLASLLVDAIKIQYSATLFSNVDVLPLLNILARYFSNFIIQIVLHDVCKARKHLLLISGVNQELILVNLLLHIEYLLQSETISSVFYL